MGKTNSLRKVGTVVSFFLFYSILYISLGKNKHFHNLTMNI